MTAIQTQNWQTREQAALVEALAGLKSILRRHAERGGKEVPEGNGPIGRDDELLIPDAPDRFSSTLEVLCVAFGLSPFERDVVLLCAGVELDSTVAPLCAAAQGEPARVYPTFGLALAALPGAHWSALLPSSPLRRWRLIEAGSGPALTLAPLRIDERVLHHLLGLMYLDERLAELIELVEPVAPGDLAPSHAAVAKGAVAAWSASKRPGPQPVIALCGPDAADRRAVAAAAAMAVGLRVAAIPSDLIPAAAAELDALVRLWEREARR